MSERDDEQFPKDPQENLLYFIEKNAPLLEPWQREIVRIVRKIAQYFYPQRQTQVMNEGWATFWHYTLLNALYDEGKVTDSFMMEFLTSHTGVIYQPSYDHPYYRGINPYALGYAMYTDLRRICEHPTDEDREWFRDFAGAPWLEVLDHAMRNFKDESFILQFLSPKVMRDLRLFGVVDDDEESELEIAAIHDGAVVKITMHRIVDRITKNAPRSSFPVNAIGHVGRHGRDDQRHGIEIRGLEGTLVPAHFPFRRPSGDGRRRTIWVARRRSDDWSRRDV